MATDPNNNESKNEDNNNTNQQTKRTFTDMDTINEPLPNSKRQKLNTNNDDDSRITKEDMEFLFQLKQQNQRSSLHETANNTKNNNLNTNVNVNMDINHISYFKAPSIASTNNSTGIDVLSTTATIHTNPSMKDEKKDKAKEIYYRQIIQRSSRVGDQYQALILPTAKSKDNDKYGGFLMQNDDAKYEGSLSKVDSPNTIGNQLREVRNQKRNELADKIKKINDSYEDEDKNMNFDDINFEDEDDDSEDEDFNMEEYNGGNVNDVNKRIMEGIMGRRSDWLPGDDGKPFGNNTRLQYLIKWKDSKQPIWEFGDELDDGYQEQIDQFEDDEMEDMLDEINETITFENQIDGKENDENMNDVNGVIDTNNSTVDK